MRLDLKEITVKIENCDLAKLLNSFVLGIQFPLNLYDFLTCYLTPPEHRRYSTGSSQFKMPKISFQTFLADKKCGTHKIL